MTSKSAAALDARTSAGGAGFVGYLTVGYPDLETSIAAGRALVACGVDIIELGLPYSDPGMDGPVIQHTGQLALDAGTRTRHVLQAVEALADSVPVLVMTYFNPVHRYGVERFARDLASAGGAGLITPDLVPDEAASWIDAASAHDLDRVFLVAPSSTDARLARTAAACRGFVYAASTMGVTGERATVDDTAEVLVARTRAAGAERVCVGLGVSNADHAREVGAYADGVIVGSALLRALGDGISSLRHLAVELADAAHSARSGG
ncbi:MAG: tryptophan synthase subunit alpha [Actinomycetes bacterium]|nr:tryptophan synthase subunit alpha [Actinomycetes bacterium]MDX5380393.1 tryptophan synthase subunit alpha [Actinomycetes bacterium]MDX5399190.1 tryptophan synthase subunit alpha [Actinomycetes bacterium]MDX5450126.1 tryptophan synthase subunit alpha [Actinomycetes bacterium]